MSDNSDIMQRLRRLFAWQAADIGPTCDEAADEIVRLRSENELLKNALSRRQAEHLADVEPYHYEFLQGATEWLLLDMHGVITMRGPL